MNTKLIIHIVISLISLSGLIVYYYAFLLGYKKHNSQLKKQSKLPEKLYFMSTYPALIWYVLPFIEQPRMHGIYDWLNGEFVFFNVLYIPVSFLLFVYFFGIWGKKSVSQNIEATKSAFYAPSKLLTEGIYARVQHPMIIGDILGHFSLVLLTGGIYTRILFPIYVFIDLFMIKIQVKYSLEPYYKSELIVYRKKTPVLLDQKLLFIVLFIAQRSRYTREEVWTQVDGKDLTTKRMPRTPDYYGYFTFSSAPLKNFDFSLSGTYTGKMIVPHYAGYIAEDRMETTPQFFDLNLKLNYTFVLHDHIKFQLNTGVQNIFNSFQKDLDKGEFRDAGYFYGPTQPRTFFIGFKIMN